MSTFKFFIIWRAATGHCWNQEAQLECLIPVMELPLNHAPYAQTLTFNWRNTFQDLGYPDSGPGARLCIPSNWWTPFLHRVHSTMALLQPVICANAGHERCYMVLQLLQLHKICIFQLWYDSLKSQPPSIASTLGWLTPERICERNESLENMQKGLAEICFCIVCFQPSKEG